MRKVSGLIIFGIIVFLASCEEGEVIPDYNIVADAGNDQSVETGEEVVLNGSASVDESGQGLQAAWTFDSRPPGSSAEIQDATSLIARFTPDVEGPYIITLTVGNNFGSSSDEIAITATASDTPTGSIEISSNITDDMVMEMLTPEGLADYIVTENIDVTADLVIEPGVIVEFRSDAGMRILQEGSVKAVGTMQDSITFRGTVNVPGHWRGLRIDSNNPENELAYMNLRHGGSEGIGGTTSERTRKANLILMSDGVRLKAHNMRITESSEYGIYIHRLNNPFIDLSGNAYTLNDIPAYADVLMFHLLDGDSDYTGNENDYVASLSDGTITSSVVWPRINVPFELPGVTVESDLEIEEGAEFVAVNNKGLYVGTAGSLHAAGSETNPVIFRGKLDVRGHWNGIRITSNNPLNLLEYVEIHNGGQAGLGGTSSERNRKTSLMLDDNARVIVKNSTIMSSQNYPFWIRGGGNMNIVFESNTISGNDHAGWVDARYFHVLDGSSTFTGNDTDRIASGDDVTMTQDRAWKKLDVPYALPQIAMTEGTLTIEAGAVFEANADGYIYINGNAAIRVLGEENNIVSFSGQTPVRGAWRGMRIRTNNPSNILSYMEIRHGGQEGIGSTSGERSRITSLMLDDNVNISVNNIAIHESREYAFWIRHANNLDITFSNNVFSGNEKLAMVDARYFHVLDGNSSYS
ncbi:MAG: PKD domain-containing protein, partial [bacterium]